MSPFSNNKKLTTINFFGGPGTGKSITAAELFAYMKKRGHKVELIHEVAKGLVWDNWQTMFTEQDYIFAHQHRLQRRLVDHDVDYVITDSSLLLGLFYVPTDYPQSFSQFVTDVYNSYTNINIQLLRSPHFPYEQRGRNQSYEEALELDRRVNAYIEEKGLPVFAVEAGDEATLLIYQHIINQRQQTK